MGTPIVLLLEYGFTYLPLPTPPPYPTDLVPAVRTMVSSGLKATPVTWRPAERAVRESRWRDPLEEAAPVTLEKAVRESR